MLIIYKLTTKVITCHNLTNLAIPLYTRSQMLHSTSQRYGNRASQLTCHLPSCLPVSRFPEGSHVIFPNGEVDPWHWLSALVPWFPDVWSSTSTVWRFRMMWMRCVDVLFELNAKMQTEKVSTIGFYQWRRLRLICFGWAIQKSRESK